MTCARGCPIWNLFSVQIRAGSIHGLQVGCCSHQAGLHQHSHLWELALVWMQMKPRSSELGHKKSSHGNFKSRKIEYHPTASPFPKPPDR
eukprot:3534213-Amphidinium_carterae.1